MPANPSSVSLLMIDMYEHARNFRSISRLTTVQTFKYTLQVRTSLLQN